MVRRSNKFYIVFLTKIKRQNLRRIIKNLEFIDKWLFGFNVNEDKSISHYHIYIETNEIYSLRNIFDFFYLIKEFNEYEDSIRVCVACQETIPHIKKTNTVIFTNFNV